MENDSKKLSINLLYIALIVSTILSFVPNGLAQGVSLLLVVAVLLCAYAMRTRGDKDGLLYNHMTYLIGTVWIGTGFILLGSLVMGAWVFAQGDNSVIDAAVARMEGGWVPDEAGMRLLVSDYVSANRAVLIQSSLVAIGPAILYFVYRVANGYGRAMKGYRIAKPNSWL